MWSKSGDKDLILTTLLKTSGRFLAKGEIRQNEVANIKVRPHLIKRRCYVIIQVYNYLLCDAKLSSIYY